MKTLYQYSAYFFLLLFALLAGCSGAAAIPMAPTATAAPTATSAPKLTLHPCKLAGMNAQCGTLSVYEDRAAKSGRMINLNIAVLKAYSSNPAPDPIFLFSGGPGGAATESALWAYEHLGSANAQRDIVLVDQRGTGGSNALTCAQPGDPARAVETLRDCLTKTDAAPAAYTTAWFTDDIDEVRSALGYDQINLDGGSYGGTAVQVYILRHGEHVRTATLESTSLLDVPAFEKIPVYSQQALDKMFSRCEADNDCHAAFPNVRQEFAQTLANLEQHPATLPINDPATGQPRILTAPLFKLLLHNILFNTEITAAAPLFIHMVCTQDWAGLGAFITAYQGSHPSTPEWQLMELTIICNEDWARMRRAETDTVAAKSYFKYEDVRAQFEPEDLCALMPRPKAEALYGPPANSSVPMLWINGDADPQMPPEVVAGAKQRYPNSLMLVAPGQSHQSTGTYCRGSIIADFIERGSVDNLSTDCLQKVPLPAFITKVQ